MKTPRFWSFVSHSGKPLYQAAHFTIPGPTSGGTAQGKKQIYQKYFIVILHIGIWSV